ncbi:hypothetical protein HYV80_03645 [Candidatus Woesearchaeota archaeon]|nr:hypothetical protein [Candidatus Woesearchaeota archaeon]
MPKLKPLYTGLSLGITLAIIYTLRTLVFWMFPGFVVTIAQKLPYDIASLQPLAILPSAYVAGITFLFAAGFVWGVVFAWVHNWIAK